MNASPDRLPLPDSCQLPVYIPSLRWKGGHWMTVYVWARRRVFPGLPPAEIRHFDVAPDARVLAHCHWQLERAAHPTLIALHGLEGSSAAHYMCGMADKAFTRGFNVVRLNQRNCGGTEALSRGLYHSGLTADARHVIDELIERDGISAFVVAGYSLGGNLALKLAGDYGDATPTALRAVCAVSPTMDLARCVEALGRRENAVYQWNFMRNLKRRIRRKARLFPNLYDARPLRQIRTIREFDDEYTAPHHGFRDAADYYHRASALRVIARTQVPTLIISAADDPFVPAAQFRDPAIVDNPWITCVLTPHGGHCAFLSEETMDHDGYWAEQAIVEWAAFHTEARAQAAARRT
jgi:predicted alpha/beta-fold hydrolase